MILLNATMGRRKIFGRSGQRMAVATGYFLVFALILLSTKALAFHPSPIPRYKNNYQTMSQSRGIYQLRNNIVSNIRSDNVHTHPVHVLRYNRSAQDNIFSGIAVTGIGFSIGVLYSEFFIIMSGCGPPNLGDTLERICYQGVIFYAGLALFNRIVTLFGSSLEDTANNLFGPLQPSTLLQVRVSEYISAIAVVGAFVALQVQITNGVAMDGLSGIDIDMCRAIRGY